MAQELRIVVTDRDGAFTFVPCLRKIRGAQLPIVAATDINHWIEPSLVVSLGTRPTKGRSKLVAETVCSKGPPCSSSLTRFRALASRYLNAQVRSLILAGPSSWRSLLRKHRQERGSGCGGSSRFFAMSPTVGDL